MHFRHFLRGIRRRCVAKRGGSFGVERVTTTRVDSRFAMAMPVLVHASDISAVLAGDAQVGPPGAAGSRTLCIRCLASSLWVADEGSTSAEQFGLNRHPPAATNCGGP